MLELLKYAGFIATITGATTLVPEIIRALKTHRLKDVAWSWLLTMLASSILWFIYGLLLHDMILMFSPIVNLTLEIALLNLKKHYEIHRHPITHPHLRHCAKKRRTAWKSIRVQTR